MEKELTFATCTLNTDNSNLVDLYRINELFHEKYYKSKEKQKVTRILHEFGRHNS